MIDRIVRAWRAFWTVPPTALDQQGIVGAMQLAATRLEGVRVQLTCWIEASEGRTRWTVTVGRSTEPIGQLELARGALGGLAVRLARKEIQAREHVTDPTDSEEKP